MAPFLISIIYMELNDLRKIVWENLKLKKVFNVTEKLVEHGIRCTHMTP